ncbi:MAG TPA: TatD family hydrolase, partial [bacterium]|nr:TatD family hydrolase [bacterium]
MQQETLFDSHAHLCHPKIWDHLDAIVQRADQSGVKGILCAGYDLPSSERSLQAASRRSGVWAAVGFSPHDVSDLSESDWVTLESLLQQPKVVAVGETGLDYHYMRSPASRQQDALRRHIRLAHKHGKPIILHLRESEDDLFSILDEEGIPEAGGVLHCFTGTPETAELAVEKGLMVSFSGILTFSKSDEIVEALKRVPMERLLIETDCPYLAPVPYRGKNCEPSMLPAVAEKVSEILGVPLVEVAERV